MASLPANSRVLQGFEGRQGLRKKSRLHLFGDIEFLCGAPLGFKPFGDGAALGFDGVSDFVETDKRERIPVGILETGEHAAPNRRVLTGGGQGVRRS